MRLPAIQSEARRLFVFSLSPIKMLSSQPALLPAITRITLKHLLPASRSDSVRAEAGGSHAAERREDGDDGGGDDGDEVEEEEEGVDAVQLRAYHVCLTGPADILGGNKRGYKAA